MATILIADDWPVNRQFLTTLLGYKGHRLLEAGDGAEALALVRAERPDLVITDVLMPTMDGFEFVRRLRADPDVARTPVVFYTSHYTGERAEALASRCGVAQVLAKPAEPEDILRAVDLALGSTPAPVPPPSDEFDREHRALLMDKLARDADRLRHETAERRRMDAEVAERMRLMTLGAEVGLTLTEDGSLSAMLGRCAETLVRHLDAAFARVWTLNEAGGVLELQASAGLYTHTDGPHGRVPVGRFKIGLIAKERRPHLTNAVVGDPRVSDQAWAEREGMVAFAGYPLVVEDRLVGVIALFARRPLTDDTLQAMASVANAIALGIEQKRAVEALRRSEERHRLLVEGVEDYAMFMLCPEGRVESWNSGAERIYGYREREILGKYFALFYTGEDVRSGRPAKELARAEEEGRFEEETWRVRKDGSRFWAHVVITPLHDVRRNLKGFAMVTRDLTERKRSAIEIFGLNARLKQRLERLGSLRQIDMAITASHDLRFTLDTVLGEVRSQLRVDAGAVLLCNPNDQILRFAAGKGFRTANVAESCLRLGEGHAGRAALEQRLVSVPDLNASGDLFLRASLLADEGFVAYHAVPLVAKGQVQGVLETYHRAALTPDPEWLAFLEALAGQTAIALDNAGLFQNLQRSNANLISAYDATIEGWARALDLRDKETEGHTRRVTEMTVKLARAMGFEEAELAHVRRGALLHDIGKLGIPDAILQKPGPLTEAERLVMQRHPEYAFDWLASIPFLRPALQIPLAHHEKWDGTGYPFGLHGDQIPLAARIFAVVDVWDALRTDRHYRPGWPEDRVREYIRKSSGTHFDPSVVDAFLNLLDSPQDDFDPTER